MDEVITLEIFDSIATLTLNRPKALNALNREMAEGLNRVFREIERNRSVRCLIITGAGDHFMAGGDIRYFQQCLALPEREREAEVNSVIGIVNDAAAVLRRLPQPAIASIRGNVAGFGMSLVAACDLAIAADNARFTQAYTQIATTPDGGNTFFLPRAVGLKRAAELSLLNRSLDAETALAWGLINKVVANDALETETAGMARRIRQGSVQAMAGVKSLLNASLQNPLEQQLQLEQASFLRCALAADFREGLDAFLEKRRPEFL
ncbi:MAG: enoyl-CoA hydratase/isomerase family protein [Gammaproteobacteria bacterium]|nr:enoyl-CoA hydratase/isomerase family protein [Gammaproteobacteria bacterium]MCP5406923.1 enoyl-CoA hydratase/isomerase family protein [Chromatiaceae bacterium]MCP5444863.1 enoyl-CoA hydratase/isomerase family protein [Chromatiaceae bacterium]